MTAIELDDAEKATLQRALAALRFERNTYIRRAALSGHDACCATAIARQEVIDEQNRALQADVDACDALAKRLGVEIK